VIYFTIGKAALPQQDWASKPSDGATREEGVIRKNELTARKAGKATIIEVGELQRWVRSLPTRGAPCDATAA
jgi:hypothetical protein